MQAYAIERGQLLGRVFMGLFGSLLTASIGVFIGSFIPPLFIGILAIAELLMIVAAMFIQRRRAIGYGFVFAFTLVSGVTLYPTLHYYVNILGPAGVLKALLVTAGAFLISALVASRTSMDFSFLGGFLFIGLLALILMGIVSFFTGFSSVANLAFTWIGIAVFVGYILFDVKRIVRVGIAETDIPWVVLSLYLDVINLLLFVLRLFGIVSSDRR